MIFHSALRVHMVQLYLVEFFLIFSNEKILKNCLGRQIDGVWHTGVGVYGKEYLFGSSGVSYTAPEEIVRLGLAPKANV